MYNYKNKKIDDNNFNHKKILCNNIVIKGFCSYGNKCSYAHTLDEQNLDISRKNAYDIIKNDSDLSHIDLKTNYLLYKTLLSLTKTCAQCIKGKCKGGYNCKFGVCLKKYQLCEDDLNYGNCNNNCGLIHLTKRKLIPFYNQPKKQLDLKGISLSSDFFSKLTNQYDDTDNESILSDTIDDTYDIIHIENEFDVSIFDIYKNKHV